MTKVVSPELSRRTERMLWASTISSRFMAADVAVAFSVLARLVRGLTIPLVRHCRSIQSPRPGQEVDLAGQPRPRSIDTFLKVFPEFL